MSDFLDLANGFEKLPMDRDVIEVFCLTSVERDMIVAALRGVDALRALAELPPRSLSPVGSSK